MDKLYFNGQLVDLGDSNIVRKLQVSDIGDITSFKSSFSYTIKLPKNSQNIPIMEMLGSIGADSTIPYSNVLVDYVKDNLYLIRNGYAVVQETADTYNVNLYDGFVEIKRALGDKKLNQLDFTALNHNLTSQLVVDSFTATSGYTYCFADYGLGYSADIKAEHLAPSVFAHTLFKMVFEQNGIEIASGWDTGEIMEEVIGPQFGYTIEEPAGETDRGGASGVLSVVESQQTYTYPMVDVDLDWGTIVGDEIRIDNLPGYYRLLINASVINNAGNYTVEVYRNSVKIKDIVSSSSISESIYVTLEVGDLIGFKLVSGAMTSQGSSSIAVDLFQQQDIPIDIADSMADITQMAFIKDVFSRYGMVIRLDQIEQNYVINYIKDILGGNNGGEDWTQKVKQINSAKYQCEYAQLNTLQYKKIEGEERVDLLDYDFTINNTNLPAKDEFLETIFYQPILVSTIQYAQVYAQKIWESDGANSEAEIRLYRPRISGMVGTVSLFSEAGGVPITTVRNYTSFGMEFSKLFEPNGYYREFLNMLESYKEYEIEFWLSPIDIYFLDFFSLKYVKQVGKYLYLNSMQVSNGVGKATLIEVK